MQTKSWQEKSNIDCMTDKIVAQFNNRLQAQYAYNIFNALLTIFKFRMKIL